MFERSKLPLVLLDMASSSQSGVFRAKKSSAQKQLVLDRGTIAFAESNLPEEHLARIMVGMGSLKNSEIREVISLMKNGKNSEEAVAAVNRSGPEAVEAALREMVVVVLSTLLGWGDFEMQFFPGEDLIKNRTKMGLNAAEMLVVSARRAVSKKLVALPERFFGGTIVSNSSLSSKGMKFPLNEAEAYAHVRAHDSISVNELLPLMSGMNMPSKEALQSLYTLGLIDLQPLPEDVSVSSKPSHVSDSFLTSIEDLLLRFEKIGLYEILSVDKDAGSDRIQTAYHELARQYHPDRFQSEGFSESFRSQVAQVFSYINKAYSTLRDPALRTAYDEECRKKENEDQASSKAKTSSDTTEDEAIEALFRLGRRSMMQGEFEKAARELKSCVHLRPDNAQYNHFLGLAESEVRGLYKSAEQHFKKAVELESMSMDSRIALVKLYLKVKLRRKASLALEEVARWDPDNPEIRKLSDQIKKIDSKTKSS